MTTGATTVSSMSRHPGLNWGPTDYEAGGGPVDAKSLLSERAERGQGNRRRPTSSPQRLASLRAASPERWDDSASQSQANKKAAPRSAVLSAARTRSDDTPSDALRALSEGGSR